MTKKVVLQLEVYGKKEMTKAMRAVCSLSGVESVKMETKMTVVGDVDPILIMLKLRKHHHAELLAVGPEKKKEEVKKEDPKKTDAEKTAELLEAYSNRADNYSAYENPNSCSIC